MKLTIPLALGAFGILLSGALPSSSVHADAARGWLNWRGPQQNGTSLETGLPDSLDPKHPLWVADFPGQSTPVVANGKVYIMGYVGEGGELQEGVICYDAETGRELWRQMYNDFLSDGGKLWPDLKAVAEAVDLLTHLRALVEAARRVGIVVFYVPHRRWWSRLIQDVDRVRVHD